MVIIDTHIHWMPRDQWENMEKYVTKKGDTVVTQAGMRRIQRQGLGGFYIFSPKAIYWDAEKKVTDMDEAGVTMAAPNMSCWPEWCTLDMCKTANDEMAKLVEQYPERFIGVAHVPQLGGQAAVEELDRAIKDLGLKALGIVTQVDGKYPDEEVYFRLWKKCSELNVPVLIHPASIAWEHEHLLPAGARAGMMFGRIEENGIVPLRVIMTGILDKFVNLKFVISHIGGGFVMMTNLGDLNNAFKPDWKSRIFFDTGLGWHPASGIRAGEGGMRDPRIQDGIIQALGADHVVFGSDYPAIPNGMKSAKAAITYSTALDDEQKELVLYKNAAELFGIKV